ncbi:MAG: cytochrome c [Pseudomonadota bacterium]
MNGKLALLILGGGLLIGAWAFWTTSNDQTSAARAYESAGGEELSAAAQRGRLHFNQNCAECHGRDAGGGPGGPPLIHKIYEPSHHGDGSFRLAVSQGVRQHHWDFGNMPAMNDRVTADEVEDIIVFVREKQRANGIF